MTQPELSPKCLIVSQHRINTYASSANIPGFTNLESASSTVALVRWCLQLQPWNILPVKNLDHLGLPSEINKNNNSNLALKFSFRNSRCFPRFRNNRCQVIQLFLSLWLRCAPFRSDKTSKKKTSTDTASPVRPLLTQSCFYHRKHDEVVMFHLEFPHQCIEIHIQYPCSHVRTPPVFVGVFVDPWKSWMTTNDGVYCHHFLEATGTQPRLSTCLSSLF